MSNKNYLIIGHGRHGKSRAAEILSENFDFTYEDSSMAAAKEFIFDALEEVMEYFNVMDCYNDRHNHRVLWYELIKAYNRRDGSRLARSILDDNCAYVGMRSTHEVDSCIKDGIFDLIIWIDACDRLPPESHDSCDLDFKKYADIRVYNNGTEQEFYDRILELGHELNLEPLRPTPKIGLDVDDVLADFSNHFLRYLDLATYPADSWEDSRFRDNYSTIMYDKDFYKSIPPLDDAHLKLNFTPACYVTARSIDSSVTKAWLDYWGFPEAPVVSVGSGGRKADVLKDLGVQYFLDDAVHNYKDLRNNGIKCFLMNASHNESFDEFIGTRVYGLEDFQNIIVEKLKMIHEGSRD